MKLTKSYKAAWEAEFNMLSADEQETVKAVPEGKQFAQLAIRALNRQPEFFKPYYQNETLNRLANTVWNGVVFGEQTMLDMMAECCSEQQFVERVNEAL